MVWVSKDLGMLERFLFSIQENMVLHLFYLVKQGKRELAVDAFCLH